MMASDRILHDIALMLKEPTDGIILCEVDDIRRFEAIIYGPVDSPYESGIFTLDVTVPNEFPIKPLEIRFTTTVFHPNVADTGLICLDVLGDEWCPAITLQGALEAIQGLLRNPNPESPLNVYAGRMMRRNRSMFEETATTYTKHFAGGDRSVPHMEDKLMLLKSLKSKWSDKRCLNALAQHLWELEYVA